VTFYDSVLFRLMCALRSTCSSAASRSTAQVDLGQTLVR
jgi:hypothetical protein